MIPTQNRRDCATVKKNLVKKCRSENLPDSIASLDDTIEEQYQRVAGCKLEDVRKIGQTSRRADEQTSNASQSECSHTTRMSLTTPSFMPSFNVAPQMFRRVLRCRRPIDDSVPTPALGFPRRNKSASRRRTLCEPDFILVSRAPELLSPGKRHFSDVENFFGVFPFTS